MLKTTAPGVPDFFQGTEFFESTLTDPDNRRLVDFDTRQEALAMLPSVPPRADQTGEVRHLLSGWENGHLKLHVMRALLHLRRELPELFFSGTFAPLQVQGQPSANVVALRAAVVSSGWSPWCRASLWL